MHTPDLQNSTFHLDTLSRLQVTRYPTDDYRVGIQLHVDVVDGNGVRQAGRGDKAPEVGVALAIGRRGADQCQLTIRNLRRGRAESARRAGHFLDLVGATNLIPGPNSTEMTMHCGGERAGLAGLAVAGALAVFGPRKLHPAWLVLGAAILGALLR